MKIFRRSWRRSLTNKTHEIKDKHQSQINCNQKLKSKQKTMKSNQQNPMKLNQFEANTMEWSRIHEKSEHNIPIQEVTTMSCCYVCSVCDGHFYFPSLKLGTWALFLPGHSTLQHAVESVPGRSDVRLQTWELKKTLPHSRHMQTHDGNFLNSSVFVHVLILLL